GRIRSLSCWRPSQSGCLSSRRQSDSLVLRASVALVFARSALDYCVFQMGQGLERGRHYMEHRTFLIAEHFHRYLECTLWPTLHNIQHLRLSVTMVLDELVGTIPVIVEDGAMGR